MHNRIDTDLENQWGPAALRKRHASVARLALALAVLCSLVLGARNAEAGRRGPGGEFAVGTVVGLPTALELVYLPWESWFSIGVKVGLNGFESESYGEVGFSLLSPELIRRPIYSARLALGMGAFGMSEELGDPSGAPGEAGGVASLNLLIEMAAMPMQMVFTFGGRRAFMERNDRIADDFNIGASGGFRYFF